MFILTDDLSKDFFKDLGCYVVSTDGLSVRALMDFMKYIYIHIREQKIADLISHQLNLRIEVKKDRFPMNMLYGQYPIIATVKLKSDNSLEFHLIYW